MKFDQRFPNTNSSIRFNKSTLKKLDESGSCLFCHETTSWFDASFHKFICSEECNIKIWNAYEETMAQDFAARHWSTHANAIKEDLKYIYAAEDRSKDIIVVVHNQLDYLKITIDSVLANTKNYHLYIWDNASEQDVQDYLKELSYLLGDKLTVVRSDKNVGFVQPNNELIGWGNGEYVILLNSDTKVSAGWDLAMLGCLQTNSDVKLVGHMGGLLNENGIGGRMAFGYDIDYLPGWCICMPREVYEAHGLFNPKMVFAYAEDSELAIRLQTLGYQIYALHPLLVHHYENKTVNSLVDKKSDIDFAGNFERNHETLRELWGNYLKYQRVDVRKNMKSQEAFNELAQQLE